MKLAIFIIYAVFLTYGSLAPGDSVGAIPIWDKLAHFLGYGVFAILGYGVARGWKSYRQICLGIVFYSGLLEVGQFFVPGRMMSLADLLANALGVAAGAMFVRACIAVWAWRQ